MNGSVHVSAIRITGTAIKRRAITATIRRRITATILLAPITATMLRVAITDAGVGATACADVLGPAGLPTSHPTSS
jgi:hypothetical protein